MTFDNLTYGHLVEVATVSGGSAHMFDAIYCGPMPSDDSAMVQIPDHVRAAHGDYREFWDAEWNLIPQATLVAGGLIPCPGGYKLVDDQLVQMTLAEQIAADQVTVGSGQVFDETMNEGAGGIRPMTLLEQGASGLVALPVLQSALCAMVDAWQTTLLQRGFSVTGMSAHNGMFSADPTLQSLAEGVWRSIDRGFFSGWPLSWPDIDDNPTQINSEADFQVFSAAMFAYVQQVATNISGIKTQIRAAMDCPTAVTLFETWEGQQ